MTTTEARDRSYWINKVAKPTTLITTDAVYSSGPVPAGSRIAVVSVSNDGFNGMMVWGRFEGRGVSISAGNLRMPGHRA